MQFGGGVPDPNFGISKVGPSPSSKRVPLTRGNPTSGERERLEDCPRVLAPQVDAGRSLLVLTSLPDSRAVVRPGSGEVRGDTLEDSDRRDRRRRS